MKPRQKSGSSSAVSPKHRDVLERSIERLSGASISDPPEPVSGLAGLYYHSQRACRTLALVLSAAFDAVHQRTDSAKAKVQRALDLEKLLDAEGPGEVLVQELKDQLGEDVTAFLDILTGTLIPHFVAEIDALDGKSSSTPSVVAQPRTLEDDEALPSEKLSPRSSSFIDDEGNQGEEYDPDGVDAEPFSSEEENKGESILETANAIAHSESEAVNETIDEAEFLDIGEQEARGVEDAPEVVSELDAEETEETEEEPVEDVLLLEEDDANDGQEPTTDDAVATDENTVTEEMSFNERQPYGVSSDEEQQAMAAALAVMESDETEEVVERARRFDPDLDLEETDDSSKRRRRRRSKSAEGLEWRSVDSKEDLPRAEEVARAAAAAAGAAGVENLAEAIAKRYEIVEASCVAEGIMGAGRILLRELNVEGLTGRVRVEITVTPELGEAKPRRRRRRSRSRARD